MHLLDREPELAYRLASIHDSAARAHADRSAGERRREARRARRELRRRPPVPRPRTSAEAAPPPPAEHRDPGGARVPA
ncbi:MAG: hypothetical protein ACFCVF_16230 [Kineosporiaceae bacterium]